MDNFSGEGAGGTTDGAAGVVGTREGEAIGTDSVGLGEGGASESLTGGGEGIAGSGDFSF